MKNASQAATKNLSEVIQANIAVHTTLAHQYNNDPHFRPENQQKVKEVLKKIRASVPGADAKLLDLGCGTGFILHLAADLFSELHGVDVTQAMLDKVDRSRGNITLTVAPAEHTPYPDASFDVATAYSFIHHVEDYKAVLKEACRVLKPKGIFYIDLEPNQAFWREMKDLEDGKVSGLSAIVKKEIDAVLHVEEQAAKDFGIEEETFRKAEYIKAYEGGIDAEAFAAAAKKIGFSQCEIRYEWFLGQGKVMHQQSFAEAATVEAYLREVLPLSAGLFKYLRFTLVK